MRCIPHRVVAAIATFVVLGSTLPAHSAETYLPMWEIEVVGAFDLMREFDNKIFATQLIQKKDCYRYDPEGGGEKKAGVAYLCKRSVPIINTFSQIFYDTTTPVDDDAEVVPLEMKVMSRSVAASTINCSSYVCSSKDGGACTSVLSAGSYVCKHRTHSCAKPVQ